ncbi:LysE family translocator [Nocardia sp. NPDC004068]|uniref:LysE family translocator n=1 Tax=Nocardia sp. NPDC004068 TaxID=3364303 RepID=UPI00367692A3
MVSADHLIAFAIAAAILIVIPGPGVLFTIGRALSQGRRAALVSVLGHALGILITLILVAAGLGMILAASALALTIIKFVGALYLIHLGIQAIRERRSLRDALATRAEATPVRRIFRQGVIVGLTNPKGIIFFSAVLPQFVDRDRGAVPLQLLILGLVFLAIALVSDSAWGLAAGSARDWFARSPRRLEAVGGAGGLMIIGLGASVAVSGTGD